MIQRFLFLAFCFSVVWSALAAPSSADRRSYVWTYEYATMPRGMAELEYYNTLEFKDTDKPKANTWKHWLELEYGLTDNWDISLYQTFKQTNTGVATTSAFAYDGYKLRTRYRFAERGLYPLDMLLYAELIEPNDLSKAGVFEGKLILAKDVRALNLSYNYIIKRELTEAAKTDNEYAMGASIEFAPAFKVGLEGKGSYTSGKHYLGPTLSFAGEKAWVNFGLLKGLSNGADQLQSRLLLGLFI